MTIVYMANYLDVGTRGPGAMNTGSGGGGSRYGYVDPELVVVGGAVHPTNVMIIAKSFLFV